MHSIVHSYALLQSSPELQSVDQLIFFTQNCRKTKNLQFARDIHAHACHSGLEGHERLGNHLVPLFVDCGSLKDAQQTFDKLVLRNECSWSGLMEAYADYDKPEHALCLYQHMQEECIHPSRYTFVALLKACANLGCTERGGDVHAELVRCGFEKDAFVGSSLVDMYAKCGSLAKAQEVLDYLPNRNVSAWAALIHGYVEEGLGKEALHAFGKMQLERILPDSFTFVCILKACSSVNCIDQIRQNHAKIVEDSHEGNPHVSSVLVHIYAKFGLLAEAEAVLDELHSQDVYAWTALLSGCVENNFCDDALHFFAHMEVEGVSPNAVTFTCILKACCVLAAIDKGQAIHIKIVKMGLEKDSAVENTLVDMYSTCEYFPEAEEVFDGLSNRDVVSWTALIAGYAARDLNTQVLGCLEQMQAEGVSPNVVTYICCINACTDVEMVDSGQTLHNEIFAKGYEKDSSIGNALIHMYAKYGAFAEAQKVFSRLADRDVISWNALITGYTDHEYNTEALACFQCMQEEGFGPTCVTYIASLKACGNLKAIDKGQEIHRQIVTEGLENETLVLISVLSMYMKWGYFLEAQKLFGDLPSKDAIAWSVLIKGYSDSGQEKEAMECFLQMCMEGVSPDTASWNAVMSGFTEEGEIEKVFKLYAQMQDQGCLPDRVIYLTILVACGNAAALERGRRMHAQVLGAFRVKDAEIILGNSLIDMYGKCGRMADAQKVFDAMKVKNHLTWSTLIAGYACEGKHKLVLYLFESARQQGVQPDGVAVLGILSAFSHTGLVEKGQKYFETMRRIHGISPTVEHFACMVDLYSRAGQLNEALTLIKKMPFQPSLVVWLTMLGACKKWGNVELGRMAFDHAMRVKERDVSVFKLMSQIYIGAEMWEDAKQIEAMRIHMQA